MTSAAQQAARCDLHAAADDLEVLRAPASAAQGPAIGRAQNAEDQPITEAWMIALGRFRAACARYSQEFGS